jgi:hypothetical protein
MFAYKNALLVAKLRVFVIHSLLTVMVAMLGALLVFAVWYPDNLSQLLGGTELYRLMILVELGLGPVMSLVIYHPDKPRKELIRDYTVIGLIQLSALFYGLYVVAQSRPVFMIFVKDRIEIMTVVELSSTELKDSGNPEFNRFSWFAPRRICVESPTDPEEKNNLLFSAVFSGKDIQNYPKYYRSCAAQNWTNKAYSSERLLAIIQQKNVDVVPPNTDFTWLPAVHRFGAGVEVYPEGKFENAYFLPVNPFTTEAEHPNAE